MSFDECEDCGGQCFDDWQDYLCTCKLVACIEKRWISVKEQLPEKTGLYLCVVKSYEESAHSVFPDLCYFSCKLSYNQEDLKKCTCYHCKRKMTNPEFHENVVYWMPLPELPK